MSTDDLLKGVLQLVGGLVLLLIGLLCLFVVFGVFAVLLG